MGKTPDIESLREQGWLKLDNAAQLFPAILSKDLTSVFRITASLTKPVVYSVIKEAVTITSKRFPYFSVSLGSGLFWHFLEFNDSFPRIQAEEEIPCTAFAVKRKDEPLYRIIIRGSRISVEFLHVLTDGGGALEYLKSLLYTYFKLKGIQIDSPGNIILPGSEISNEEMEDSYKKFFRKLPSPDRLVKAWHLPFRLNERPRLKVLHAEVKVDEILAVSRRYNVSLTEYFLSVYFFALQEIFISGKKNRQKGKVLRIELPVNMRKKLASKTMRNFSLFLLPELDLRLGTYTFEEVLLLVHHQLSLRSDIKQISRFLSQNVGYEKLFLIRLLPLFIKKMAISAVYRGLASKRFTGLVTNLGLIDLPEEMGELIDYFELIPPPPNAEVKVGVAMVSFKNKLRICFSNNSQSTDLERRILKHLADENIHVRITNS
jgi:NRPS condensation-like uncharacterized protein